MIQHSDRTPTMPGRRLITPEGSSPFYAVVTYADEPSAEGTLVNKALLDEFLAASGITTGTVSALLLAQAGFSLADGAVIRFRCHVTINGAATLNVNGTGAKPLRKINGETKVSIFKDVWATVIYSAALNAYVLQSDVSDTPTFSGLTMTGDINMGGRYIDNAQFR